MIQVSHCCNDKWLLDAVQYDTFLRVHMKPGADELWQSHEDWSAYILKIIYLINFFLS
jgi:hypothetical protein